MGYPLHITKDMGGKKFLFKAFTRSPLLPLKYGYQPDNCLSRSYLTNHIPLSLFTKAKAARVACCRGPRLPELGVARLSMARGPWGLAAWWGLVLTQGLHHVVTTSPGLREKRKREIKYTFYSYWSLSPPTTAYKTNTWF